MTCDLNLNTVVQGYRVVSRAEKGRLVGRLLN